MTLYAEFVADLTDLQRTMGVFFANTSLLTQALVHSSYVNENPALASVANERLEFLGDAILGLVVAEKLYQDFPHLDEGKMTKLRAGLVRREALAHMARAISLGDYLYLGKGEEASGGRHKPANLAGAMEAVIAAIFLAEGLPAARDFIWRWLYVELHEAAGQSKAIDYKSELQELVQARKQTAPSYHLIEAVGPDHDKRFTIEVRLGETVLGKGSGKSRKTAEAEAARSALERLSEHFTP
ncbi:MAG: ribonuclease III [Chloroflexota bacterium]